RSYVLHPLEAAIASPGFAIDENPLAMHVGIRPEVWSGGVVPPPQPLEIRLQLRAAERAVRIDALVCTRSTDRAGVFQARTRRAEAGTSVQDGDSIWTGSVKGFVEIYVWVAPPRDGS